MGWVDGMDQDTESTGERNWRRQARNMDEWKKLLRMVGAHLGLLGQ
jgi:hypothetical protein